MKKFDSIRPYHDDEVHQVLIDLSNNRRFLKMLFSTGRFNKIRYLPFSRKVLSLVLKNRIKNIKSVSQYQDAFEAVVSEVIKNSIKKFSITGIENLDPNKGYLFVANHRDITLDSALLNFSLHKNKFKTTYNAVGNNLLSEKWASDLMRLNKSFIIQRSGATKKDIYKGLSLASEYIHELINKNESVWIAQKQGRAKDGIDSTDPALLKMIHLHKRKEFSISEYFNELKVVPVAVSYEYDPNDINKAIECAKTNQGKDYIKSSNEDISSIAKGITDKKGDVSINVGSPLKFVSDDSDQISDQITKSIRNLYEPHSTNYAAYIKSKNEILDHSFSESKINESINYLESRATQLTKHEKEELYSQYYQCLIKKMGE